MRLQFFPWIIHWIALHSTCNSPTFWDIENKWFQFSNYNIVSWLVMLLKLAHRYFIYPIHLCNVAPYHSGMHFKCVASRFCLLLRIFFKRCLQVYTNRRNLFEDLQSQLSLLGPPLIRAYQTTLCKLYVLPDRRCLSVL